MYFFGIDLCNYSNIFGKPGEGVHSIRVPFLNLALVDIILTILFAIPFSKFTGYNMTVSCAVLFGLAFLLHWAFCVPTALNVMILGR
jgi:hypothetical protein